ncbi:MAG: GNAT family N-acetyltransferase, partial [Nocardioides sp.]|uniref:GNAT family N-acetyltransferase n=1 Tax=Nocardioides sp. TaxID=35761 RepID=UPI0039E23F79
MSRTAVTMREAHLGDTRFLQGLWQDSLRRADAADQVIDLELIVKTAAGSPEQRLLIAEYDGVPAGAVFLRATTFGPLNLEPALQIIAPHVVPPMRRHGVGRALMDAAVAFAEELGIPTVSSAALAGSRDGNRFLARLGFGPQATLRQAPTATVRGRLTASRP